MNSAILEIVGYIGSAIVVVAMLMSSIVKLRIYNTVGRVISTVYAILVGALPLALMNVCLIVINVYNLIKLFNQKNSYDLIMGKPEEGLIDYEIDRYAEDISQYFPGFSKEQAEGKDVYFICCGGNPAGMLIGSRSGDTLDVLLDYSTPTYRDCTVAKFVYNELEKLGIKQVKFEQPTVKNHIDYMKKMGYKKQGSSYIKTF